MIYVKTLSKRVKFNWFMQKSKQLIWIIIILAIMVYYLFNSPKTEFIKILQGKGISI